MQLHVPVDFERLPEFRALRVVVGAECSTWNIGAKAFLVDPLCALLFLRLWVDLAYQATITRPLGLLPPEGVELFVSGFKELSGAMPGFDPIKLLVAAGLLKAVDGRSKMEDGAATPVSNPSSNAHLPSSFLCERFARWNEHLALDHKSAQVRGAEHSALARNKRNIAQASAQQSMLLPPASFKKRDNTPLTGTEMNRALTVINMVDNCLKLARRRSGDYPDGLLHDAVEVCERYDPDQLETAYYWIIDHRDHPGIPKTTEQLLANFGSVVFKV